MPSKRTKFFTGTPIASRLDWTEEILISEYSPELRRYLLADHETREDPGLPSTLPVNWRQLTTGAKPCHEMPHIARLAFDSNFASPFKDSHNAFLEHSLAVLDNLQSSQIAPHDDTICEDEEMTFLTATSFVTDESISQGSSFDASHPNSSNHQPITISGPISSIKSLPTASYLQSIRPQTITTNLVVGIISVASPKTVTVRRGNYTMDVVEMIVGDDTKAGFSISTWLAPEDPKQQSNKNDLRHSLRKLRPGDVVLLDRLALSVFRDQVFGQSLNRKTTRNVTRFVVIDRDVMDGTQKLSPGVGNKIHKVQDWVDAFIGRKKTVLGNVQAQEYLPPDTQ